MSEFVLIKNNGIGNINGKNFPNCCIFISLSIVWRFLNSNDFNHHKKLFEQHLNREVTPEEMVFSILKVKHNNLVVNIGELQIDTLIEKFSQYTNIKITMFLPENGMKFDLFKEESKPDAIIIQYPNHFECAIPRELISKNQ